MPDPLVTTPGMLTDAEIQQSLPLIARWLPGRRWFGGKTRSVSSLELLDSFAIPCGTSLAQYVILKVAFEQGEPDLYALPLVRFAASFASAIKAKTPAAIVGPLENADGDLMCDALVASEFSTTLLSLIGEATTITGSRGGSLVCTHDTNWITLRGGSGEDLTPGVVGGEQSNTSIRYGERLMLKAIRRIDYGRNPELEFGRHFAGQERFLNYAPFAGAIEYQSPGHEPCTLAILQGVVHNEGDAWPYALSQATAFLRDQKITTDPAPTFTASLCDESQEPLSPSARNLMGRFADDAARLGQRTAEMHLALALAGPDSAFAPEPFTPGEQISLYKTMTAFHGEMLTLLARQLPSIQMAWRPAAEEVLARRAELAARLEILKGPALGGQKIRCHGDYHLGQVLFTGQDFVIIDFEGPPMLPIATRRQKRPPLNDVAGMVRSFHYAARSALADVGGHAASPQLAAWANAWYRWTSTAFLHAWLSLTEGASFLPASFVQVRENFELFLLDKALYELGYELNHRPDWVGVPLGGVLDILGPRPS